MQIQRNGVSLEIADNQVVDIILGHLTRKQNSLEDAYDGMLLPRVGTPMHGAGGIFAGIIRGKDHDSALILGPMLKKANFEDAGKLAAAARVDGHEDFRLPTRSEQALLYANLKDLFEKDWYWSNERHADDEGCAWCQWFNYGYQYSSYVDVTGLGCAVRVIPI